MPEDKVIETNIRMHEKKADEYEQSHPDIFNEREEQRIGSALEEAESYIDTGSDRITALDVGCGTGNVLRKLESRHEDTYGMDLSEEMLWEAMAKDVSAGGDPSLVRGRVNDLPFPDDSFDLVTAYSLFHHLPEFDGPASEIGRVLKDGGVVYIDHEPIGRDEGLVRLYIKLCDVLSGDLRLGLPPYDSDGDHDGYCDYQISHGEGDGGLPLETVGEAFEKAGIELVKTRKYLSYGSDRLNPFYHFFQPFAENEWLIIGRK